jgi:hypothetical protein
MELASVCNYREKLRAGDQWGIGIDPAADPRQHAIFADGYIHFRLMDRLAFVTQQWDTVLSGAVSENFHSGESRLQNEKDVGKSMAITGHKGTPKQSGTCPGDA